MDKVRSQHNKSVWACISSWNVCIIFYTTLRMVLLVCWWQLTL